MSEVEMIDCTPKCECEHAVVLVIDEGIYLCECGGLVEPDREGIEIRLVGEIGNLMSAGGENG